MKLLEEIKVSVYGNVFSRTPKVMSFLEVISMCIQPVYASNINTIRRYHEEGDHEAAQKIKSKLPCFTPAGTFDGAHAIKHFQSPSNIIGLDYDHVPNRLEIIKRCAADPHTVAALESPTDGVKVFAFVEGIEGRHREAQQLVSRYYDHLLELQSDPACKDESRLCYFTYSPNGYIASLYQPFELEKADASSTPEEISTPSVPKSFPDEEIKSFLSSYIFLNPLTTGQRHSNLFKLACEACRRGYPQESILRELSTLMKQNNFPYGELTSVLRSGYQKVNSNTPSSTRDTKSPSQTDKLPKLPYNATENLTEEEEAYWQGEELRKKTPCFPQKVYENLPDLLNECIIDEANEREQDISFLSVLTALSAVLPQTFGIYNHKKYSPHFFTFISAPAGSGKSIAQIGRYLMEDVHMSIFLNSKDRQKKYESAHRNWIIETGKKKKTGEPISEEPQRPPFRMLIIPASTSYTRLQIQMQDNGEQGSIIFDTEAQTLSNANHMDCGNFDDMLRKAFEHEYIDSSYKANGIIPIHIRHPKLALLLTGTPGQLNGLLNDSENGIVSRIILYTFRGTPQWKEMGDDGSSLEDRFKPLSHRVVELYHFCLERPTLFHFTHSQWNKLNKTFSELLKEVALEGNDDLQAVVKRYAFLVMRISMILTRIRQFEARDLSPEIYCNDLDFERALSIVLCCYEHSRLLHSAMPAPTLRPLKNPDNIRNFINELSETFTTEEAIKVGANYNFSNRKVARLLNSLNNIKIKKISHGTYTKIKNQ